MPTMHGMPPGKNLPPAAHSPVPKQQGQEEENWGTAQKVTLTRSRRMVFFAIFVNIILLAQLTAALYIAAQYPDEFTGVFFKEFFTMLIPTVIVVMVIRRIIGKADRAQPTAISSVSSHYSSSAAEPSPIVRTDRPQTAATTTAASPAPAPVAASYSAPIPSTGLSLSQARSVLFRARFIGYISAFFFAVAFGAAVDSLQSLVRHEFNAINLVPGETIIISGMMPADAETYEDLEIIIEGESESGLTFIPLADYRGFWFGGNMWRGELSADLGMRPGHAVLTIKEVIPLPGDKDASKGLDARERSILFGGRQNPALVFGITVWSSAAERQANDTSLFRRYTGFPAFGALIVGFILAVSVGIFNWRVYGRAENALAEHGIFLIHGVKILAAPDAGSQALSGYRAAFARVDRSFARGEEVVLLDRTWKEQSRGRIMETDPIKAFALFPQGGIRPQYGWMIRKETRDGVVPPQILSGNLSPL